MSRERFGGRGRSSGGGGSRGGPRRGGGGGRGGDRRRRGGRDMRGGRSSDRGTAHSGNQRERIAVESGSLVFIDQFMLANPQFIEKIKSVIDEEPGSKDSIVADFGGAVVSLEPGTYRIERDPFALSIIIHKEGLELESENFAKEEQTKLGDVFVDTRCVAMIDRELLDDAALLEKYQALWFSGQDKACRDLIRDNGGAVRYGFQRLGDELEIFSKDSAAYVCLFPREGSITEEGLLPKPEAESVAQAAE
jgi:hypothetical protein